MNLKWIYVLSLEETIDDIKFGTINIGLVFIYYLFILLFILLFFILVV